jgi:hypothetical protein
MVDWDEDLRHNSNNAMETLVRMGEHIGQRTNEEQHREYLSHSRKNSIKNATITQLISYFPTTDNLK